MKPGLRAALILASFIAAAPAVASSYDKMQYFQELCDSHGTALVSTDVPCLKALLSASKDPIYNMSDPATALFVLEATRTLQAVEQKSVSESLGKEKLLRLLLTVEDRHRSEVQAAQLRDEAELARQEQDRATAERIKSQAALEDQRELAARTRDALLEQQRASERQAELEQQRNDAAENLMEQQALAQRQQRAAAVQFCIVQAQERSEYAFNAPTACATDPNYYQTVLRMPKSTNTQCQGFGNQINCTTR